MITVTESAALKVRELIKESELNTPYLRVGVKGGGCSGLAYDLAFDTEQRDGDELFENNNVKILVDRKSLLYLLGTELDYTDGLNGKGFQFINPQASRTCGCGESFAV